MKFLNSKTIARISKLIKPTKSGYLQKRGHFYTKSFKRRFFVLTGNILCYYENQSSYSHDNGSPVGVIFLEGHTVEMISDDDFPFTFVIQFPNVSDNSELDSRVYILAAESNSDMEDWITATIKATFDWTKISVEDMEEQLSVLNATLDTEIKSSVLTSLFDDTQCDREAIPRRNPFNEPEEKERFQSPSKVQSCFEILSPSISFNDKACSLNTNFLRMTFDDLHTSAGMFWNDSDSKLSTTDDSQPPPSLPDCSDDAVNF